MATKYSELNSVEKAMAWTIAMMFIVIGLVLALGVLMCATAAAIWGVNTIAGYTVVALTLKSAFAGAVLVLIVNVFFRGGLKFGAKK